MRKQQDNYKSMMDNDNNEIKRMEEQERKRLEAYEAKKAIAAIALVAYLWTSIQQGRQRTVFVVNGTSKPYSVSLNGKQYIDLEDSRITGAGMVGMWTKADSVTLFDDFTYAASVAAGAAR